jgi:ATP-dependent exoDNAse (exonuclease V) beta subunit
LVAQNHQTGVVLHKDVANFLNVIQGETVKAIRSALRDCVQYAKAHDKEHDPTQHVTVLVRTNYQLSRIGQWCEEAKIPCYIKQEGTFYSSAAVRDLYSLLKAYVFPDSCTHLLEYLHSSFGDFDFGDIDSLCQREELSAKQAYLQKRLEACGWQKYKKAFRFRPILSVLREMITEREPVKKYVSKQRYLLSNSGKWNQDELNTQLLIDAKQYEANMDKLFHILRKHFSGEMASLYRIYEFIKLNIATNKTEDEPDIKGNIGCGCVYGMTVHKAKGLEFDTVLLPITNRPFRKEIDTEILIDETCSPKRVGWSYVIWDQQDHNKAALHKCNDNYKECLKKEVFDLDREEARLLYVALTRSIRKLQFFLIGEDAHSWTKLLKGGRT